jgi:hypothetical protein
MTNVSEGQLHLKRVHLGVLPIGSTLSFKVESAMSAAAKAVLEHGNKELAKWEWSELHDGRAIEKTLNESGTHTLTFMVPFTGATPTAVEISVSVNDKEQSLTLVGQQPDIGKAIAVVIVR